MRRREVTAGSKRPASGRLPVGCLCLVAGMLLQLSPGPVAAASKKPHVRIDGLEATLEHDRATVSFRVTNGLSENAIERIHSGIEVEFEHRVEIVARRSFLMPAERLAQTMIRTRAAYDSLTGRYSLYRTLNFRTRPRNTVEPLNDFLSTDSFEEMRRWMVELKEIPVFDPSRSLDGKKLRVRVRSNVGRRYVLLIFPSAIDAHAEQGLSP